MSIIKTERLTIRHIVADDWKSIKEIWDEIPPKKAAYPYHFHHNNEEIYKEIPH